LKFTNQSKNKNQILADSLYCKNVTFKLGSKRR